MKVSEEMNLESRIAGQVDYFLKKYMEHVVDEAVKNAQREVEIALRSRIGEIACSLFSKADICKMGDRLTISVDINNNGR